MASQKLLLFDIDGTLVRTAGAGKKAMERAYMEVFGRKDGLHDISMMGRMDPSILREAMKNHQIPWTPEREDTFRRAYFNIIKEEIIKPRDGKKLCPGVLPLLQALQSDDYCVLGLLTGNWEYSGRVKLEYFGVSHFFPFGAFADDSLFRKDLVPIALDRYFNLFGKRTPNENVFVIGDTPLDIQNAKPHGVKTVAVATGFHTCEDLARFNPDHVFENFESTPDIVRIFQ